MSLDRLLIVLILIVGILLSFQTLLVITPKDREEIKRDWLIPKVMNRSPNRPQSPGMAACLMVRDDNSLLHEWLAYHYITLPLRFVLVGADQNSIENPHDVLQKWDGTELRYKIWSKDDFIHRFGEIPASHEDENHHYLHRQRAFISSCAEYMKAKNQTWVIFIDTDEYVAINRINQDDLLFQDESIPTNSTRYRRFQQRHSLNLTRLTALDAIRVSNQVSPIEPCHIIPRLLIGALENETCSQMDNTKVFVISQGLKVKNFTTLRFVQTAPKNKFYPSKWGKTIVDVSRISNYSLGLKPKSSHRPFRECPKPLIPFEEAILHANHYLGSWERYSARKDVRRSPKAFQDRAFFSHGLACSMQMDTWVPLFFQKFGALKAKMLLGFD
jgi:hypothetical protein